jgi:hypothetical protein
MSVVMHALENLVVGIETIHGQAGLPGMVRVRAIIPAAVTPPEEAAIIELSFSRIVHRAAFRKGGVTVNRVH